MSEEEVTYAGNNSTTIGWQQSRYPVSGEVLTRKLNLRDELPVVCK